MKNKPTRLIRFVEPGVLPAKMAAQFDEKNNLMLVDRWVFDHTNVYYQNKIIFANSDVVID